MSKQYLDKDGLQIVANKVNKKQDSFITGKSLEFVTIGQGEIDNLLYLGANNELVTTSPEQSINVEIMNADKALGLANQLVQIRTQGFIGGCGVTINSLSPQTSTGAVAGDTLEPTQSETLFPYHDSFSAEFREWCQTYGVSIMLPLEQTRTLVFYISVPQLSINTALGYVPDDTQTTTENSWSASFTKSQIKALSPVPLVSSDTAAIVDDTVDTWGRVDRVIDSNDEPVETYPDVTDGFLLQKFLWNTTPGAEELPQTMTVNLRWVEIYYGYFGIRVTCNGTVIGQTIYPTTQGSEIFENNIGITWDYWTEGTYTVSFTNSTTTNVQKVEVNNAIDEEAREVAAGAMALAESVSDKATAIEQNLALYNSYSFDEKWTGGTWVDGKKIYKKTYDLGNIPSTSSTSVYCRIPFDVDFETIVEIKGMVVPNENSTEAQREYYSIPKPPRVGSSDFNVSLKIKPYNNVLNLELETKSDLNNKKAYATVYYTKNN